MASKKVLKWLIGMSSVAMFTGFVGLSQKYDQTNVAVGDENSNADDQFNSQSETAGIIMALFVFRVIHAKANRSNISLAK